MTYYVCNDELVCENCAVDVTDDERAIGGSSDCPQHCAWCHAPLFDDFGLTAEGIAYVLETVRSDLKEGTKDDGWRWENGWYKGLGKPAVVRDWAEHVLDNCYRLDKRDKRTLELYLHFTQWAQKFN